MVITVSCPSCSTSFPVDSNKIPAGGVNARCSSCGDVFRIERPEPAPVFETAPEPEPEPVFEAPTFDAPVVGSEETDFSFGGETAADESDFSFGVDAAAESEGSFGGEAARGSDFSFGEEAPASTEDESGWVLERDEDLDPGSLTIDPMETVESSVEDAKAEQPVFDGSPEPDLADPMALRAESAESFFAPPAPPPAPEPTREPEPPVVAGFSFGKRDPKDKARRLARVLVSDMISYNPDRHERALANGSIKEDFEEEIQKSWKEYVEQVGEEMANENPFWVEALNDVLAKGQQIF